MNEKQLEKLAKNPHYKMDEKELQALEEFRRKRYINNRLHSNKPVKHSTAINKHDTSLEEEDDQAS